MRYSHKILLLLEQTHHTFFFGSFFLFFRQTTFLRQVTFTGLFLSIPDQGTSGRILDEREEILYPLCHGFQESRWALVAQLGTVAWP